MRGMEDESRACVCSSMSWFGKLFGIEMEAGLRAPTSPEDEPAPDGPAYLCSACFATVSQNQVHVIPWFNDSSRSASPVTASLLHKIAAGHLVLSP